jgi:NTP pyrophosphatase (non-canonical NTP hydrolase)
MSQPDNIQWRALDTWYDHGHELELNLQPSIMGLAGEAGELLDLLKKDLFKPGHSTTKAQYLDELGDCLYYLGIIAYQLGYTLDELSQMNHAKLTERENNGIGYNRGVE